MRRSWITWSVVGGIILLLTLFLGLQYNWQLQAGDAEREKLQKSAEIDVRQFAEDFDREIQAAYYNFQMDPEAWADPEKSEFRDRYAYWRSKTEYPGLIKSFYYLPVGSDETLHYNLEKQVFESEPITEDLREIKQTIENPETFRPVVGNGFVLAMPVHERGPAVDRMILKTLHGGERPKMESPARVGHLLIFLDRDVITQQILPDLARKHFSDGNFRVAVLDREGNALLQTSGALAAPDASERLLNLSPDNFIFFSREVLPRLKTEKKGSSVVVNQHVESRTYSRVTADENSSEVPPSEENSSKTFSVELNDHGKKKDAVFTGTGDENGGWTVSVQHNDGSVAAFVQGEQNKRMLAGSAIYLLVVGSIIAIVVSAMRSQRHAQRQIDFVSSVSHEFRTPIAVICSAGENLADGIAKSESQVAKYGELINGEGRRLSSMVEQILEFAGARSGKRKYTFADTDINRVVESSLAECSPSLKEGGFEIEATLAADIPAIKADQEAISSAVQNLIRNAVKYSNGNRWIRVSTSNRNRKVAIDVEDRGIGISESDLKKIFEPFYRSKEVVDAQIHGNGLGLSLVKEIAEAHGGNVSAVSEIGKGSKFTIELPDDV